MKRLVILAFIALACTPKQEIRYARPDWPTPEEVRRDLKIPEIDSTSLESFTFDSTLSFEPLGASEIAVLDSARLAYFQAVQDSFPDMSRNWWATCVYCWLQDTYDSLATVGKASSTYQEYLRELNDKAMYDWFFIPIFGGKTHPSVYDILMSSQQWNAHPISDSLYMFKASVGHITTDCRSKTTSE